MTPVILQKLNPIVLEKLKYLAQSHQRTLEEEITSIFFSWLVSFLCWVDLLMVVMMNSLMFYSVFLLILVSTASSPPSVLWHWLESVPNPFPVFPFYRCGRWGWFFPCLLLYHVFLLIFSSSQINPVNSYAINLIFDFFITCQNSSKK